MNVDEQKAGEARVRGALIDRLDRLGLKPPAGVSGAAWAGASAELCQRLAYMTDDRLEVLAEVVQARIVANRWPAAVDVLRAAAEIQPPPDDASPLLRAVFAHPVGQAAIAGGYGPELLAILRRERRWPGPFTLETARRESEGVNRRLGELAAFERRGDTLTEAEAAFRANRMAAVAKCRAIGALGGAA